jgi:hypothetical protein
VSHLAKYRKLIPALALVFALVDTPDSGGVIHERELIRALAMGDYLRPHAERLYAAAVIPETTARMRCWRRSRAASWIGYAGMWCRLVRLVADRATVTPSTHGQGARHEMAGAAQENRDSPQSGAYETYKT